MCGIAGIYRKDFSIDAREQLATRMNNAIRHRGPDGDGLWSDDVITLAHRRLSIIDLSEAGAQPMASHIGDWVISFNGEIYNYLDLRRAIPANWRGHSDTEVIAEALQLWGFERTITELNGMFALAAYHRPSRTLYIARDRLGEKPVYYAQNANGIAFASELIALMQLPDLPREIDPVAANALLMHRYIPAPLCILQSVRKLQAAHYLKFTADHELSVHAYWQLPEVDTRRISETDLADEISARILKATQMRMISDVPLGAFLSGGIDSSAIVAAMQRSGRQVKTYTISFDDPRYDEAPIAREVANAIGTQHTEFRVSESELIEMVPNMAQFYSEPFADFSQIPTLALSKYVRRDVTVALAGDGGDECFAGYPRMQSAIADYGWRNPFGGIMADALAAIAPFNARKQIKKLSLSAQKDFAHYYDLRYATWHARSGINHLPFPETDIMSDADHLLTANKIEMLRYLPEDVLTKTDRASMAHSLEIRAPFLDHTLIEFVWSLPTAQRAQLQPKGLLRQFLTRQIPNLPDETFARPKQGFEPPLASWLRGPLHDWAQDLLASPHASLNMPLVRRYFTAMVQQKKSLHGFIWPVLMLLAWEKEYQIH